MSSNQPQGDFGLKISSRYLYEEEPQPPFEPPTPLRHNYSLPGNMDKWKGMDGNKLELIQRNQNIHQSFTSMEMESALSPSSNPAFYPVLRGQCEAVPSIGQSYNGHRVVTTDGKSGEMEISADPVGKSRNIAQSDMEEHVSSLSSAVSNLSAPSIKPGLSPRLFEAVFGDGLWGNNTKRKVDVSNFDISVVAPTSL